MSHSAGCCHVLAPVSCVSCLLTPDDPDQSSLLADAEADLGYEFDVNVLPEHYLRRGSDQVRVCGQPLA